MTQPWAPVLDRDTPGAALPAIIDAWTARALEELRAQLEADADFTPEMLAAILTRSAPLVRLRTEQSLTDAWLRLQPRQ